MLTATNFSQSIVSPYFPGNYEENLFCEWTVTVDSGNDGLNLTILIDYFDASPRTVL